DRASPWDSGCSIVGPGRPPSDSVSALNVGAKRPPRNPRVFWRAVRRWKSAGFERLEALDLPLAAGAAAGRALQPGLRAGAHVAREKVAAGHAVFAVRGGERG